jgi:undecaprenyl-diphosphatase
MVGGLLRGLYHEAAAHFSSLIASPIIFGARSARDPKMLPHQDAAGISALAIGSGAVAALVAFILV